MQVYLLAPKNNKTEKTVVEDLTKKIEAIGAVVEFKALESSQIMAVIFDGRELSSEDYLTIGRFYQTKLNDKSKRLVAYLMGDKKDMPESLKKYFDYIALVERNFINYLKEYLFSVHKVIKL